MLAMLLVSAGLTLSANPTAEEVVAYIVHGLEDGAIPRYGQDTFSPMKQTSRSPAVFVGTGLTEAEGKRETERFTITRLDHCLYSAERVLEEEGEVYYRRTLRLDLRRVSKLKTDLPGQVELVGLAKQCLTTTPEGCDLADFPQTVSPFFGNHELAQEAIDHFHLTFCPLEQ